MSKTVQLSKGQGLGGGSSFKDRRSAAPFLVAPLSALGMFLVWLPVKFALAGDAWAFGWGIVIFVAYGVILLGVWYAARTAPKITQAITRFGFLLAAIWSLYGASDPNLTWRFYVLYVVGSVVLTIVAWASIMLSDGNPDAGRMSNVEHLRKAVEGIRKVNSVTARPDGRVEAAIEMHPGLAIDQVDRKALASAVGVPSDGVLAIESDHDARIGKLVIDPTPRNVPAVPWPGPSKVGGGLSSDPILIGPRSKLYLAGDPKKGRNLAHILVVGMPGAGKSEIIRYIVLEGMSRPGFEFDYVDVRKADQSPGYLRRGARAVATTTAEAKGLLKELYEVELPRRSKLMGDAGHASWTDATHAELGIKLRVVVLDEVLGIANKLEDLLVNIGETSRSLGVVLLLGAQKITYDRMPTSLRANFSTTIVGGVKDASDAETGLTEAMQDAGARPELWQARNPGMHYMEAPGDDEEPGSKRRSWKPDTTAMERWADSIISERRAAEGAPHTEVARRPVEAAPAGAAHRPVASASDDDEREFDDADFDELDEDLDDEDDGDGFIEEDFDEDDFTDEERERFKELLNEDDEDDEDEREAGGVDDAVLDGFIDALPAELGDVRPSDVDRPITLDGASREVLIVQKGAMREDLAHDELVEHLKALRARGLRHFKAQDEHLMAVALKVGFGRSWLRKRLDILAREGGLIRKVGSRLGYEFV